MSHHERPCPDCDGGSEYSLRREPSASRRDFLRTAGTVAAALGTAPLWTTAARAAESTPPETIVKTLFDTLTPEQKQTICFDWNFTRGKQGLLRTHISNNWHITEPHIVSDFYTKDQQAMIRKIFEGIIDPDWHKRIDKQLEDDAGGYGNEQNIAIFGQPGSDKFELVMTGRHMTIRCDGNSTEHVAFGGPIFYGHAASGFNEKVNHPGNVFWHQAIAANKVYEMLDGKQRERALVEKLPDEIDVRFRGQQARPGIALADVSSDQRGLVEEVLKKLLEPYRQSDRDEARKCLTAQGGLEKCSLAFYREGDLGNDQQWDCWRLEGPSFVWYYRGTPHVHVWVNIADDPSVETNSGLLG